MMHGIRAFCVVVIYVRAPVLTVLLWKPLGVPFTVKEYPRSFEILAYSRALYVHNRALCLSQFFQVLYIHRNSMMAPFAYCIRH